jgi:hypothetical protein
MTMRLWTRRAGLFAATVFAGVLTSGPTTAATFQELARFLPDDVNAIVVVNAEAMYASPLGQRENLRQKYADRFEAAPLILPPSAERMVLAAEVNLSTLRPEWQAAVMDLSIDPSLADVARNRGGRNDALAGREVTWLGNQTCILKFGPEEFGVITPTTRPQAGGWAADVKAGVSGQLSPYLEQAIEFADTAGTDVVLAVDLANTFAEQTIRERAANAEPLAGVAIDKAAPILASVQGVKFGVKMGENLVGRVQLDFSEEVGPLAAAAKPLLLKILARAGAMLPEFNDWQPETGPHSLALQGPLTEDGMRRIFSLLEVDAGALGGEAAPPAEQATSVTESADAAKASMGRASLRYFRGISKYVDDLNRLGRAASLDQAVMWIENYARRVQALPTRNVDPELIQYGQYVAQTFQAIVDQAWGALDNADAAQQPVVSNLQIGLLPTARTVNWGGNFMRMYAPYGHANIDVQATNANIARSQEQIDAAVAQAKTTLTQLISDHQMVRSKLSERYGLKF